MFLQVSFQVNAFLLPLIKIKNIGWTKFPTDEKIE
jgi:hypothetical protein